MKFLRDFAIALGMIAFTYVGSYIVLSLCGRYEATENGAAGPKWYELMPIVFSFDLQRGPALQTLYFPLHWADCCYWHEGMHPLTYERRYGSNQSNTTAR